MKCRDWTLECTILGSIPGRVIPKTQKLVLDASLLNTQHYKVRIKGKVEQSREGVAPSPTHWCSSYLKGSLRVTLDYGRQLLLLLLLVWYCLVLWLINQFRLFNANSISCTITVLFHTIQFKISTHFKYQNSSISIESVYHRQTVKLCLTHR